MSDLARRAWPFRKLNQARSLELIKIAMVGLLHISSLIGYGVSNGAWYLQVRSPHTRLCVKLTSVGIVMRKYDRVLDAPGPGELVERGHRAEITAPWDPTRTAQPIVLGKHKS